MIPEYPALPAARPRWPWLVLLAVFAALQWGLCFWAARQAQLYPTTGLRFGEPLQQAELENVLDFMDSEENTRGITASFWGEQQQTVTAEGGRQSSSVICIGYCGDARDCLPVTYSLGDAPGVLGKQCALSDALAQELFGSLEVLGLTVRLAGETYSICGVFEAQDKVLLYPSRQALTCAELRGVSWDIPKTDAEQWCAAAGLPTPYIIRYGPQRVWLARLLCLVPLLLAGIALLAAFLKLTFSWSCWVRSLVWFSLALAAALLLPVLLRALPGWLIPSRWSDLSFWPELFQQIREGLRAQESTAPYWRDLEIF